MSFEEWFEELELNKDKAKLPPSFSPQTTYSAVVDNKIIGMVNVRWELVPVLLNLGGLIGYSIRPDERGKGYGTEMLRLALKTMNNFDKVLVTCKDSNIASKRVIEKNNGVLENSYFDKDSGCTFLRYWIKLK
jgi:predicted acetyltransferase